MMVLVFSFVLPAFAEQPLLDYYNNSELVLVGKVISLSQVQSTIPSSEPNQTHYDIQVEQYYKNPQSAKLITVYGFAKGIYYSSDPTYDVGDRVFLYINKENGHYQIQPHSLRLHNNCDARPLIPMPSLPFEPPIISMPAFGRLFTFSDSHGNEKTTFAVGEDVNIKFNAENYFPVVKHAGIELSVMTENNTKLVFTDKKENITIPACNGNVPVSWSFRPETPGQYSALVNATGGLDFGRTEVFYSEPSIGNGFMVSENSIDAHVKTIDSLSPLKQFKSGIATKDISCNNELQLVIKAEDKYPACVKPSSIKKLVSLHWALEPVNELTVEKFKDTYKVGEKIDFVLKFKGFLGCGYPSFIVKNAGNKTIWESPTVLMLCDPDTGYGENKWKFGELYNLMINQTGSYAMNISVSDKTIGKEFFVIH